MRPAEGLKKPRLCLQGVFPCWLANKGRKSLALEAASSPHYPIQTGKHPSLLIPHHRLEGDQGKDLAQLHRDRQGHLECDPGGITETMVSTHTRTASRVGETLSVCLPGRQHHRTGSGQVLSHKQTGPRRGLSPAPQRQPRGPGVLVREGRSPPSVHEAGWQ